MIWVLLLGIGLPDYQIADAKSLKFKEVMRLQTLKEITHFYLSVKHDDLVLTLGRDNVYLQPHANGCAAACVAMVLDRIQVPIGFEEVSGVLDTGKNGAPVSLLEIKAYVEGKLGLNGTGYHGSVEELMALKSPVILFVDGSHYVVLSAATTDGAIILDPAFGRQFWPIDMLKKRWHGIYFEVTR